MIHDNVQGLFYSVQELYCKKEECLVCLGCAVVNHHDHKYDFISQIAEANIKFKVAIIQISCNIYSYSVSVDVIDPGSDCKASAYNKGW